MARAAAATSLDVASVLDDLPIGRFHFVVVICCILIALTDGYDIAVIGVAAPSLVREWKIANIGALAPAFSAGLVGGLLGPPIFGVLGDRFGRKTVLLGSSFLYGVLSLATMAAGSLAAMTYFRLVTGIALGGVLPTAIALGVEYAPRRYKFTFGMIVTIGVVLGAGLPGPTAVALVPTFGWRSLFFVGGVIPMVLALVIVPAIPESLKFLSLYPRHQGRITKILARLRPDLRLDGTTRYFNSSDPERRSGYSTLLQDAKHLFAGQLAVITPLLWIMIMACFMATYFFQTWMPTLIAGIGLPPSEAVLSFTWFALGGCVSTGGLSRPINIYGVSLLSVLFLISVPIIATLGAVASSPELFAIAMMAAGFCLNGLLTGILALAGVIYPTRVRSSGVGWTLGIGRFGGIAGPYLGGMLVGFGLQLRLLTYAAAMPLAFGLVASLIVAWMFHARGQKIEEIAG